MDEIVNAFSGLFRGRTDVWGSVEGRSNKETVTNQHYKLHLEGKRSLGVYMLLDDATCHFAALDIDEKDFSKALSARNIMRDMGVSSYISESKGKGYHVYLFAQTAFVAKDVRQLLRAVLDQAGYNTEIFPKQDALDDTIKYGNYINLPYFKLNSRQFLNVKGEKLSFNDACPKIQRVSNDLIEAVLQSLPAETPLLVPLKTTKKVTAVKGKKQASPACIQAISRGVSQGQRDVAAFALARHYLDQGYLPEEVLAMMIQWDKRNNPPIGDQHVLQIKVQSAAKGGYRFGCNSIIDEALLAAYCPGKDQCQWLIDSDKDRKKKGFVVETSFLETETHLYEEIMLTGSTGKASFVSREKTTGEINYADRIDDGEVTYVPFYNDEITEEAVRLPTGLAEYSSLKLLVKDIKAHIYKYLDLKPKDLEFVSWYVIMTWTYDKLPNVQYLRFLGDTGCGKSRSLDVIGDICYKTMMLSGAVTPAPIYRIIKKFRGTLVLDEADFSDTTEKSEVVTILNCGYERGRPIVRCAKDDPDLLQILPCFGPKLFATRFTFEDKALESRCMTVKMVETTRSDIPPYLGRSYHSSVSQLRNQLLLYRLRTYTNVDPEAGEDIDLGNIEPRLKQTGIPYAIPFMNDPEVMDRYKEYILQRNQDLIQERADSGQGRLLLAFLKLALEQGKNQVTANSMQKLCSEEMKMEITTRSIGKIVKSLGITKRRAPGGRAYLYNWDRELLESLKKRYYPNETDFDDLFSGEDLLQDL